MIDWPDVPLHVGKFYMYHLDSGWKGYPQFLKYTPIGISKKEELLAMPNGSSRPTRNSHPELAGFLVDATTQGRNGYDAEFDKKIRKKQSHWFISIADIEKRELLSMPTGCKKPINPMINKIAGSLGRFTSPQSQSYDANFDKEIRVKQPRWFVKIAETKKQQLLSMPRGCKRPSGAHPLWSALNEYTNQNRHSYNAEFDKTIKKRQPHWFVTQRQVAAQKRAELLRLKRGSKKPEHLKGSLQNYISKTSRCYDSIFDKTIRRRQPHWFIDKAEQKKMQLLALPKGCKRPNQKKHPLGAALSNYTAKESSFNKAIRKKQPGWFK